MPVRVFYSDGRLPKHGGCVNLVHLDNQWHLGREGYLCKVDNYAAGLKALKQLQDEGQKRGVVIPALT